MGLVAHGVGEPDHVEVIDHDSRVGQDALHHGGVALVRIDGRRGHVLTSVGRPCGDSALHRHGGVVLEDIGQSASAEINEQGHPRGRGALAALQEVVQVQPEREHPLETGCHRPARSPVSAAMMLCQ